LHDLEPGRHRRHGFHADHQRAGGRDSRRVALVDAAGVSGRHFRAAPHAAAVALVRSSRHRRGDGGALHDLSRPDSRRPAGTARGGAVSRVDLTIPDIGNFTDVSVVDVLVKPGDVIAIDSPLVTLETDKASIDVPATAAGTIAEVSLKRGHKLWKGSLLARVDAGTAAASVGSPAAAATSAPPAPAARRETAGDTVRMPSP